MEERGQELYKAGRAGCAFLDVNRDFLEEHDWSLTPLGARENWECAITVFVNLISAFPHPAAVFWKVNADAELVTIHNLSFGKLLSTNSAQGRPASETFAADALDSLQTCLQGRTVEGAYDHFLPQSSDYAGHTPLLLSPLHDELGEQRGILAQLLSLEPRHENLASLLKTRNLDKETDDASMNPKFPAESESDDPPEGENRINLRENKLFRSFAQMLPIGLAVLNADAEALFVNSEFFALTSNRQSELGNFRSWPESIHEDASHRKFTITPPIADHLQDYGRVMEAYRNAFATKEGLRIEFRCAKGDNDPWRLFQMRSIEEQPAESGYICAVIDITEIKAAELSQRRAALEASDRKEQQERFIDMISHEIRNPLSAVLHSAEEIKDTVLGAQDRKANNAVTEVLESVETILLCVAHQSSLVDDILSFSKLDAMMLSLSPKKGQPKEAFSECLKLFQPELRAKKISFEYVLDVSFVDMGVNWILADLRRIKQVLVNLMTNAIKFTTRGHGEKKIMVGVGASKQKPTSYPPNVVFFDPDDNQSSHEDPTFRSECGEVETFYLMVSIKDTGIGISVPNQARLFERFRQATPKTQDKYGGSGLGLFISRKLCQLHGGDVGVASTEGSGSTFGFFFKARKSGPPNDGDDPEEALSSLSEQAGDLINKVHSGQDASLVKGATTHDQVFGNNDDTREHLHRPKHAAHRAYTEPSLNNPPVRLVSEAHPASAEDDRYEHTRNIFNKVTAEGLANNEQPYHSPHSSDSEQNDNQASASAKSKSNATASKKPSATDSSTRDEKSTTKNSLLLVEDNQINQKILSRQLKSRGFDVTPAFNGQEAVDAITEGLNPDIILMDQEMPVLSGTGATKAIRALESDGHVRHIPILGVSANVREEHIKTMKAAGMDEIIAKPYKVEELVRRIHALLPRS